MVLSLFSELRHASWLQLAVRIAESLALVFALHYMLIACVMRMAHLRIFRTLASHTQNASRILLMSLLLQITLREVSDDLVGLGILQHINALVIIASLSWFSIRCVTAIVEGIAERYPMHLSDNLRARRIQTQTNVIARCLKFLIVLIGVSAALTTFPSISQVGASLLASAGVAGLVIGFAAKPVFSNLLAGLQIALTQPIRLGDAVIIKNEWGWIEEITSTYIVIKIWDERRLIVPLQWFIENPFENWTRSSTQLIGSVPIWVDYRLPLDPVRAELLRLCNAAPEWDRRVCLLQLVDTNDHAMQIRALVSAADSALCWDLRCRIREGLIAYIDREYPQYLSHVRTEWVK